jgi:hypothetical protein
MTIPIEITPTPQRTTVGGSIDLAPTSDDVDVDNYTYTWAAPPGKGKIDKPKSQQCTWHTGTISPGSYRITVHIKEKNTDYDVSDTKHVDIEVDKAPYGPPDKVPVRLDSGTEQQPFNVSLSRTRIVDTPALPLYNIIRRSCARLSFRSYKAFTDYVICDGPMPRGMKESSPLGSKWKAQKDSFYEARGGGDRFPRTRLPFPDVEAYRLLKAATEAFMMVNCGVSFDRGQFGDLQLDVEEREERLGLDRGDTLPRLWSDYVVDARVGDVSDSSNGHNSDFVETIPYLALVREKLPEVPLTVAEEDRAEGELCYEILREKFTNPCFLELIWSYWHEESMLVQTMNAISWRFQNRRGPQDVDPLANLAIDPLRPLSNLIWGYVQDEQHRLTLARRVYEYNHEYGLTLFGSAVPKIRAADTRSKFLESFHTLLHRASIFYKEDDDTTMLADPFPVLNALRDVHLLLAEGAHNQYGDLPWTARHEMLMQQWLLARPEFREFLPTRVMVAYPEPWMDRVDAMKRLQGWTDTSVRFFHDLGVFGEQILLSIRFGDWSNIFDREEAGNWARYWRQEVQWYIHAYQTVTGVDLSSDMQDVRQAELRPDRYMQPAFHLQRRLVQQRRAGVGRPVGRRVFGRGGRIELEQGGLSSQGEVSQSETGHVGT